ncbi:MAG: hypothetical protein KAX15_04135, partial [Candidatus Omnitrophica bacterium]|nr:hypothetical protein [Candidatus Omnitrophota bacterium]
MLLPLKSYGFIAKNYLVQRPNRLAWTFAFRTLVTAVSCVGKSNLTLSLIIILGCSMAGVSCGPIAELKSFSDADLTPPVLVKVCSLSPTEIELTFDEQCTAVVEGLKI